MGVSRSVHGTFQRARHGILEVKLEAVPSTIWPSECAVASYNKNDPTKRGRVVASRGDTGCVKRCGVQGRCVERLVGRAYLVVIRVLHRLLPYCPKSHRACPRLRRRGCFTAPPPERYICAEEARVGGGSERSVGSRETSCGQSERGREKPECHVEVCHPDIMEM